MDDIFKDPGDPTLDAALKALQEREGTRSPSRRLGGSAVGHDCTRRGWYSFRWTSLTSMSAPGLLAVNDGHRSEIVMAELLRGVPGIQLWTEDPEKPGEQISFELVDGHFVGKLDGVILGLIQAPRTAHVWEAKAVNLKKFDKLKKDVIKFGEKNALEQWDIVYFAQAQMYMKGLKLDRHYLTVASPGVREIVSVRTDYQPNRADMYEERARSIVFASGIPSKISNDPANFQCKWCDHSGVCHESKFPEVNCRTCEFASPTEGGGWWCAKHSVFLTPDAQAKGCRSHRWREQYGIALDGDKEGLLVRPEVDEGVPF